MIVMLTVIRLSCHDIFVPVVQPQDSQGPPSRDRFLRGRRGQRGPVVTYRPHSGTAVVWVPKRLHMVTLRDNPSVDFFDFLTKLL